VRQVRLRDGPARLGLRVPTLEVPNCQQVVGIDRDPEVGSRFQIARGQPWNYSPDAFKN
jgi:hypothetical protein